MQKTELLLPGNYYHIYNHAVGGRNLFHEPDNYEYFLHLYDKYLSQVANTLAWVLMPNHFHLLVKIKDDIQIKGSAIPDRVPNPVRGKDPSLQFSKLFNSYAQAYNKRLARHGALFERPFKRKSIDTINYLVRTVHYIHNNPVHHGFCSHPLEYSWSSYLTCTSAKQTKLLRKEVLHWFGNLEKFQEKHNEKIDLKAMERWLEMDAFHSDLSAEY